MRSTLSLLALLAACTPTVVDNKTFDTGESGGDAGDDGGDDTAEVVENPLSDTMDIDALMGHLEALQAIGDAHNGTRVAGSPGYEESIIYATEQLEDVGYEVTQQAFTHRVWRPLDYPSVTIVDGESWNDEDDVSILAYSAGGDVTATLVPVDVIVPVQGAANTSDSGCESADFADFPAGSIALIQRGTCYFDDKARNAAEAGASAIIIFNEGQSGRRDVLQGTLGSDWDIEVPIVGTTYALGAALYDATQAGPTQVNVVVDVQNEHRETWNLWADLAGENEDLLVVGGHLDSVSSGPGINDNGSGTALVLELARQSALSGFEPVSTVRFALWGAEEAGLLGSQHYVDELDADGILQHAANLNFDMVASPNGGRFIYDGDMATAPNGSEAIEDFFTGFFDAEGQDWAATAFDGRSDYGPFIAVGIPAGGLFSGAEQSMSSDEAAAWGGQAGQAYDACYHDDCDDIDNIDPILFLDMARAAAHATEGVAMDPELSRDPQAAPDPVSPLPPVTMGCAEPDRR
jgi:Zn-dependent M28 family amino/carboxypeptidase